ncbi:MAG: hypothetical protein FWF75_09845 [Propionibacteriaceae bacterium]|nr:hypothetical protein [Propionibacteriaceae bacterium]
MSTTDPASTVDDDPTADLTDELIPLQDLLATTEFTVATEYVAPQQERKRRIPVGIFFAAGAIVVTLAMGMAAVTGANADLGPSPAQDSASGQASIDSAHDALLAALTTASATSSAATTGTTLPDGTPCSPALAALDSSLTSLDSAIAQAKTDVNAADPTAFTLGTDQQVLQQAIERVATACKSSAARDLAARWTSDVAGSQQQLSQAQALLASSQGKVADDSTRTALTAAIQAVQAAQGFSTDGKDAAQTTAATVALTKALAGLTTAVQGVQASQTAWQTQQSAAAAAAQAAKATKNSSPAKAPTFSAPKSAAPITPKLVKPPAAPVHTAPAAPKVQKACYAVDGTPGLYGRIFSIVLTISDPDEQGWTATVSIPDSTAVTRSGTGDTTKVFVIRTNSNTTPPYSVTGLPAC